MKAIGVIAVLSLLAVIAGGVYAAKRGTGKPTNGITLSGGFKLT